MMKPTTIVGVALCISLCRVVVAATWCVDGSVTEPGDGRSWEAAFQRIQKGIDAASDGDTVTVAEGVYIENIQFKGKNIALTSTDPFDASLVEDTIIDGNQAGSVVTFSGTETQPCVLSGFTIRNGKTSGSGGGINGSGTFAAIQNSTITANEAAQYGGGLHQCHGTIQGNTITGNSAGECGGGFHQCHGTIQNNMITGNSATHQYGGGFYYCNGTIRNNTITGNSAGERGGGLSHCGATIQNCILWGNTASTGPQVYGSTMPTYSCIQDWTAGGEGNISQDPQFADQDGADNDPQTFADNDYRLLPNSPCIDAGKNEGWMPDAADLDGNPRIVDGNVDMGAYERVCLGGSAWYVTGSVGASGDGSTWETAFKTIQEGVRRACSGDTVIVAEGTYVENIQFRGKNIVLTSTDPLSPQVVDATIIDGNKLASVVTFSGTETEACVLSGFTIRNGSAQKGGGIKGSGTQAMLQNNTITANSAQWGGGLFYCAGTIENNTITGNAAGGRDWDMGGGGLYGCNGTIRNNTISGNSVESWGGGLFYCDGTIQNNIIKGNSAKYDGGGLLLCNGTIRNNTITGNSATSSGGGLSGCYGRIQNNMITGNSAGSGGGLSNCHGTIQNNTIGGNSAERNGGGLWECDGTIQNNTITGNSATESGGGLYGCFGTIRNCILWRNTAPTGPQLCESSMPTYSCIQDWSGGGEGNTASEPLFLDLNAGDYRLQEGSPCIDAGANYYWFAWPQRDADGNCRLAGLAVDMGCYEYSSSPDADGDLLSDADESAAGTDPLRDNSDGDGLRDGLELLRGSDPVQVTPPGIFNVPSDTATIQESLCLSIAGDEIIVAPGTYPETLQFCGPDVILRSSDPGDSNVVGSTILDGGGAGPVVSLTGRESKACVLAGFTIRNGNARDGGGIEGNRTLARIQYNTITGNSAERRGGGLCECGGTIQNNTITGNSAGDGGGLWDCDGTIQNNSVSGNSGGGLASCDGRIQNNTIAGNSAALSGGGLFWCNATIQNCIVWGNTPSSSPQLSGSGVPTYSCIEGWSGGGQGNISPKSGPGFVNPNDDDYHLQPGSPCIDTGKNEDWMLAATDLDGNPRVFHGGLSLTVDMGAYEYGSWSFRISQVLVETTGGLQLTWSSRPGGEFVIWSSTDLTSVSWVQEQTIPSAGDSTSWTDPSPGGSLKFYRVEQF